MHLNITFDRLLHLLVLIIASAFFAFIVQYWTESGLLFSFSGGVTIAVQLSNAIERFRNSAEGETSLESATNIEESTSSDGSSRSVNKRPNKKQLKSIQRRKGSVVLQTETAVTGE